MSNSPGTPVSSTNKTDRHDITEILLNATFNNISVISWRSDWFMMFNATLNIINQTKEDMYNILRTTNNLASTSGDGTYGRYLKNPRISFHTELHSVHPCFIAAFWTNLYIWR